MTKGAEITATDSPVRSSFFCPQGQPQRAPRAPEENGETLTCNLCALRALCGLTLFGMFFLPFLVWPKLRLRKYSRRAKKKTVGITKEKGEQRGEPQMHTDSHR